MPPKTPESHDPIVALDIKAGTITLPILKLFTADLVAIGVQLEEKLRRAPDFFRHAPVVVDLGELGDEPVDFPALAQLLRRLDLVPAGVRGGNARQRDAACQSHWAVLAEMRQESAPPPPPRSTPAINGNKFIQQPVRSGQRIYAQGGDLIVHAPISAGAEVMADGNIHVYGSLRGRALAGAQGNPEARIFCSDLQAELVGIGGNYKISESFDDTLRGKPVQIYLQGDSLIIEPL
ncbi:septum site-determining protein MinC [Candidatus Methylocalor cossyra]|uniref:Probable septum site-determining protein MinC n=1 Tax=Candidatus Methylocalor cossyra TaxID=3108543 RepID=A0ABM9NFL4_9GAMM